jgi:hypothetical protein
MRALASDRVDRWTRGTGIVALVVLAWAVFLPDGLFGTAVLAAALTGAAVATGVLVRSRRVPSAQVIATAEAEPGIRPSPRGERKP